MPLSSVRAINMIEPATELRVFGDLEGKDLNFYGLDTQYSTHSLHAYLAAMNPYLAHTLIDTYVPVGENVLDPYCGGGCVLVESVRSNRACTGGDINPLANLITSAKTTFISLPRLQRGTSQYMAALDHSRPSPPVTITKQDRDWFKPETLQPLARLQAAIEIIHDIEVKHLFRAVFSATVRSSMLTYRGEVRLRRLNGKDYGKFNPQPFRIFSNRLQAAIQAVANLPSDGSALVSTLDAKNLPHGNGAFHSVVCSPPYADDTNGVGYFQFSRVMLDWLGHTPEAIKAYKRKFLGGTPNGREAPNSETLHRVLEPIANRSERLLRDAIAFYSDYNDALNEMLRVARRYVIIVIGNRVLARTAIDNAAITTELMEAHGANLVGYFKRYLRKKRIANLGGDGGGTAVEHILVYSR